MIQAGPEISVKIATARQYAWLLLPKGSSNRNKLRGLVDLLERQARSRIAVAVKMTEISQHSVTSATVVRVDGVTDGQFLIRERASAFLSNPDLVPNESESRVGGDLS